MQISPGAGFQHRYLPLRDRQKQLIRQFLADTAIAMFLRDGYAETSIAAIAEADEAFTLLRIGLRTLSSDEAESGQPSERTTP